MKLAVLGAAVLWGTAGTAGLLVSGVDPISVAAARLVVGGLALVATAVATAAVTADGPAVRVPARRGLLLAAALGVAAYQLCYFAAISRTGVAVGTVVAIGSGPVFTGLLSWALDRVAPTRRWAGATAAAVAGCAVLTGGGGQVRADGVLLALLGGLLYAFYAVAAARVIGSGVPSDTVMGALFGGAGLVMLPVLLWTGAGWLAEPRGLLAVLYLGCATTALAYVLYGRGLRTTPVATAATLALAEPAVAALLGVAVLGERFTPVSAAGLLLMGAGLVSAALPERRAPVRPAGAAAASASAGAAVVPASAGTAVASVPGGALADDVRTAGPGSRQ
ncbi:transporter [Planomonospora parontospora subsp. parontospora]|uniref:Transporter n=2 Tax=Planomonospora parontospora TaxID=58119 RepID=A0AA37BN14_9ACTN|nr:EamA family transporter [Planomonospora parontospora]GGK95121.1 transporter [Planomonospora parontospora]GII12491.1 transporter [Planomonospora parontospora subsp. parontospora]